MLVGLFLGLGLALLVAGISWKAGFLSRSGAMAASFVGALIFGLGGIAWVIPLLFFFASSSLLTKVGRARKRNLDNIFQKGGERDWGQVWANGFFPALCVSLYYLSPAPMWHSIYLAALGSATADTWGTEIGVLSKQTPISVTSGKPVPVETSGGITLLGCLGSLAGAFSLVLVGWLCFPGLTLSRLAILTVVSLLASFLDSILGALVQSQFQCTVCSAKTEKRSHCGEAARRTSGISWVGNDEVNLLSNGVAALLTFLLIKG